MSLLPIPRASRRQVDASDPRFREALDAFAESYGFRAEEAFLPTHWAVFEVDGLAELCFNADGVRALAAHAPRPDALNIAEVIIRSASTLRSESAAGLADRHEGQAANLAAAETGHRDDRARVERAVALLAKTGAAFTADHVHDLLAEGDPYDRNLVSSVLGVWSARGDLAEDITQRPVASRRRSRRASRNRWWRGIAAGDS